MKNLIVAAAMVIFILIVMGWQRELGGMLHQKQRLQYAAEEAAASIAMDMAAAGQESEDPDKKAEESLLLQMAGAGGPCQSDVPVSAEAGFDRKGEGNLSVVVTVRQGKLAASGWYPVPW